jgi:hypothetical protein
MDDWQAKTFTIPSYKDTSAGPNTGLTVNIDASNIITKIPRSIAGNNANLWMSQMVTETPLMTHITNLHPHIIRFPGGSISDVFFWNAPKNIPPADAPTQLVKADGTKETAGYWYGKNSESWTFSVDNYYSMLQQTGNQGMITINYGYARYSTAQILLRLQPTLLQTGFDMIMEEQSIGKLEMKVLVIGKLDTELI